MPDPHGLDWETAFDRAYGAAFAVLREPAHAEEVAQEACVKALVKLETFEGRSSFPSWVRAIAYHLALDVKRGRSPADLDPDTVAGDDDPEAGAFSREASDALQRCLGELTERQRVIFLGKHLDYRKGAELASEMKTREGTIWATLSQAAANLRRCLARHGFERESLH